MQDLQRILVVEDETEIRELIVLHLERDGYKVESVGSAEEGEALLNSKKFSLLVLDWMLPGMSGPQLARSLRKKSETSDVGILMVTAKAAADDIIAGLEAGADDYLTKPFDPAILLARVKAMLRRTRQASPQPIKQAEIKLGGLVMNPETYEVHCGDSPISLTPSEFKLLLALAHNRGRVLTRNSLIDHVQGEGVAVVGRTVDTHVFGLRKKLGDCADVIETVRGIGYRVKAI
jgi:two-component system, OmpR family, phosphate regulon response regulator PhoB